VQGNRTQGSSAYLSTPSSDVSNPVLLNAARPHRGANDTPYSNTPVIPTAPLPDPIAKSIDAIIKLHAQEERNLSRHQRLVETIATFFGRPLFMYTLLAGLVLWILDGLVQQVGLLPAVWPPFQLSEHGLDVASLLISTGVLIRQTRQEKFAEQRAQLTLQLNLLSEHKIAKIISLLEELRADLPDVIDRHDPEAAVMQQAADPLTVLEILQENLSQELADSAQDILASSRSDGSSAAESVSIGCDSQ